MSSLHTSRQRYLTSMATSASFAQTQHSPKLIDRRRSRVSFCGSGSSRVDPENMQMLGVATRSAVKEKVMGSCLDPGSMVPSKQDDKADAKRKLTLIRYQPAPSVQRGKRTKDGTSNTSFTEREALEQIAKGGGSQNVQKLLSPDKAQAADSSSPRVQKRKTISQSQQQTSMQYTSLGPTAATAVPGRKQSRWSRKKSLEAQEAAFRAQIRPKSYNYVVPNSNGESGAGPAAATASSTGSVRRLKNQSCFDVSTLPARRHYDMVAPMASASSTVSPPWATGY